MRVMKTRRNGWRSIRRTSNASPLSRWFGRRRWICNRNAFFRDGVSQTREAGNAFQGLLDRCVVEGELDGAGGGGEFLDRAGVDLKIDAAVFREFEEDLTDVHAAESRGDSFGQKQADLIWFFDDDDALAPGVPRRAALAGDFFQ